jgi:tol-pal system protein YbgF
MNPPKISKIRPGLVIFFVAVLMLSAGCSSQKRVRAQQSEMDTLRRELRYLKDQNSQLRREFDALQKQLSEQELNIKQSKADLSAQMLEVSQQVQAVQNQLQDINYRITAVTQRGGAGAYQPPTGFSTADSNSTPAEESPSLGLDESRELYNTAYRDLIRGNYQLALQGFRQFMQEYPNNELADNAQYWIGEVFYAQGRFPDAIQEFEKVVKLYRSGDKTSSAILKIGYAYLSIGETEQGKIYLEEVIKDYPDSQEANLAKGRLATLE